MVPKTFPDRSPCPSIPWEVLRTTLNPKPQDSARTPLTPRPKAPTSDSSPWEGLGFRVWDLGFWVYDLGLGLGFRVLGLGSRV